SQRPGEQRLRRGTRRHLDTSRQGRVEAAFEVAEVSSRRRSARRRYVARDSPRRASRTRGATVTADGRAAALRG
ncbi:MAG: hypothetical protein OXC14_18245, partial [Rhodospirillaceae bacterium]|nr:hypothetical protein [Rhodospirillaceae bacterium]